MASVTAPVASRSSTVTQHAPQASAPRAASGPRYEWAGMIPFFLVHLGVLGALWSGVTWQAVVCCVVLYVVRMFGVTAGYHRYFAHRSFKTGRVMQFLLALLAESSAQKGVLWWAAHHRRHHKASDTPEDVHSPVQRGFWYAHLMWIYDGTSDTDWDRIQDFARYPELRFLNRFWILPPVLLGFVVWLALGWSGLFIGFFLSTVLLWHGTFLVNSLAHVIGKKRFDTGDESRNSLFIALLTLGEGWHNNHHHYQSSTRQGFYWWEVDVTYYVLKAMSWVGWVRDLREPPARLLAEGRARRG
jgi:stearoyl-CoA desaturase (Delta-9 desaturase)